MAIVDSLEVDLARCLVQARPCFSSCAAMGDEGLGATLPLPSDIAFARARSLPFLS